MDTTKAMILELLVQARLQGSTVQSSCLRSRTAFSFYDSGWMSDAQSGPFRPPPANANRSQRQLKTLPSNGSTLFLSSSWRVYILDLLAESWLVIRPNLKACVKQGKRQGSMQVGTTVGPIQLKSYQARKLYERTQRYPSLSSVV